MSMRDHYLTRAAELHARACDESDESRRREYAYLARQVFASSEGSPEQDLLSTHPARTNPVEVTDPSSAEYLSS